MPQDPYPSQHYMEGYVLLMKDLIGFGESMAEFHQDESWEEITGGGGGRNHLLPSMVLSRVAELRHESGMNLPKERKNLKIADGGDVEGKGVQVSCSLTMFALELYSVP